MPHKGLPRCKNCGSNDWTSLKFVKSSATIRCNDCSTVSCTRSVRGIETLRELAAITAVIDKSRTQLLE